MIISMFENINLGNFHSLKKDTITIFQQHSTNYLISLQNSSTAGNRANCHETNILKGEIRSSKKTVDSMHR